MTKYVYLLSMRKWCPSICIPVKNLGIYDSMDIAINDLTYVTEKEEYPLDRFEFETTEEGDYYKWSGYKEFQVIFELIRYEINVKDYGDL